MSDSTSRLLRGFLEPCLLALLAPSPDYGLSLMRRLSAAGLEEVPGGSLYPALTRLEIVVWAFRHGYATTFGYASSDRATAS